MAEEIVPVKTALIKMRCDECKVGFMERVDGIILTSDPPQFRHTCNNCGKTEAYIQSYPYTVYRPIDA